MANTFTKIASATVGSGGASSIDFTSIPSTYTDLCLKISARNTVTTSSGYMRIEFNGVTTNFSSNVLYGAGGGGTGSFTPASPYTFVFFYTDADSDTASTFSNAEVYIPNYAGSTNKSINIDAVSENNGANALSSLTAGLWSNTSAITSVKLTTYNNNNDASANFKQYSTAVLYGISKS
jgi:hypothetical protein